MNTGTIKLELSSAMGRPAWLREIASGYLESIEMARFEWGLVWFATGIAVYFSLPIEPALSAITMVGIGSALVWVFATMVWPIPRAVPVILLAFVGLLMAKFHTLAVDNPILPEFKKSYTVKGWIEKVNQSGNLQHFYVRVTDIENLDVGQTPKKVRIRTRPGSFKPGDAIQVRAILARPPIPVISEGFDSGRRAYFEQIGGYGFAISKPEMADIQPLRLHDRISRSVTMFRYGVSRHIQARAPPETAGLQAALLTGDRSGIPEQQEQSLRDAGLAHLLAISGLHMGLLAGGAYYFAALLFAMIGPWARRYDMRKWAALIGALFATAYLLISGANISTQRAYIMALIIFAALMLDRRALSLRSVAVAAAITLILHPESLLGAGFQMSFAATAALVVVYRFWADRRELDDDFGDYSSIASKLWIGIKGLWVTSLVAGLATGGFAALHFHRIARFGLLGNLAAMPMFTFIVMPAGFLAMLMMPFGLDRPFLHIMGAGLNYVLMISDWVSGLGGAVYHIKAANAVVLSLFSLGFVFLCLGPKIVRITGLTSVILAFIIWAGLAQPDIRVSQDGRVAFWDPAQANVLQVDAVSADRFGRSRFIEQSGVSEADVQPYFDKSAKCDDVGCRLNLERVDITILQEPEGVMNACLDSGLVILTKRVAGPVARRNCRAVLIDTGDLKVGGARDITLKNGTIHVKSANPKARKNRPWGQ